MLLSIFYSFSYANEPVDIWSIEKEKVENITTNSDLDDNNETSETIVINNNLTSSIEEGEILNKRKVVGLYDPEENGFDLDMWNNTDPKKIFELSKKINNMKLSEDAKNIYTKLLLTNSYSPKDEIDEKVFLDIKSDWLIKFRDVDLIKKYLKKNIDIDSKDQLTKFVLNESNLLTFIFLYKQNVFTSLEGFVSLSIKFINSLLKLTYFSISFILIWLSHLGLSIFKLLNKLF